VVDAIFGEARLADIYDVVDDDRSDLDVYVRLVDELGARPVLDNQTLRRLDLPGVGPVETWVDLAEVSLPFVSFRHTFVFATDGAVITSDSTLRFRSRVEVADSLRTAGFVVREVRDAPDRPGRELVFISRPAPGA
jgi:hypothetical protein